MNILTKIMKKRKMKILWQGRFENLLIYKNRNQYRTSIKNFRVSKVTKKGKKEKAFYTKILLQINKKITINEMSVPANTLVAYDGYFL